MKNIIAIVLFLPLVITDPLEEHPPDLRYDITKPLLSSIFEKLRQLSSSTMTNFFKEWISHNQPFVIELEIGDSKNISFSKFISDEEIIWFLKVDSIKCGSIYPYPSVNFTTISNKRRNMSVEGTIKFLHRNHTPGCHLPFGITLDQLDIKIHVFGKKRPVEKEIHVNLISGNYSIYSEPSNNDEESCKNAYKDDLQSIYGNIFQIVKQRITKRLDLLTESVIPFIHSNCPHVHNKFRDKEENYYVYFKLDRNIDMFPWVDDYEEIIIRGLNDMHHLEINFNDDGNGNFRIYVRNVKIDWSITSTSVKSERFDGNAYEVYWSGSINNDLKINNSKIGVIALCKQKNNDRIDVTPVMSEQLRVNIANGIEQTFQSLPRNYVDVKVAETITKILQPFDKKSYGTLFFDREKTASFTFLSEKMDFSTITLVEFGHLETISCSLSEFSKIGTINYEKIIAKAEFSRDVDEKNIHRISISSKVYIKNATVHISLDENWNSPKRFEVIIEDTFNHSNSMVMIDPGNYYLSKKNRILIGKQIFDQFVNFIRDQINETTNSMLNPIYEVCQASFGKATKPSQELFFVSIHDRWDNDTKPVSVDINGWWNYKFINIQYINKTITAGGLRIENVTANIKQIDESKKTMSSSSFYTIECIFLTIKHTNKDVQVKIPKFAAHTNASIKHNTTASDQNEINVMKNLELTIASFIEQSIYGDDENYYKYYQNLVANEMSNAIQKYDPQNNQSPLLIRNFAEKLPKITELKQDSSITQPSRDSFIYEEFENEIKNYYMKSKTRWQIDSLNLTINPAYSYIVYSNTSIPILKAMVFFEDNTFFREEICDHINHSGVQINVKGIQMGVQGEAEIVRFPNESAGIVFYVIDIMQTRFFYNFSNNTLQMEIDDKNIQVRLHIYRENNITQDLKEADRDFIRKKIAQITSSLLTVQLHNISTQRKFDFCRIEPEIINETGSIISQPLEKYFYSMRGTVAYTSRRFLMYYIQIYGLLNLKTVSIVSNAIFKEFEFKLTNLTARILWSYYVGGHISKIPVVKMINVSIDEILLSGKFGRRKNILTLAGISQMKFEDQENSFTKQMLKYTFEPMVLDSIQESIRIEFDKTLLRRRLRYDTGCPELLEDLAYQSYNSPTPSYSSTARPQRHRYLPT